MIHTPKPVTREDDTQARIEALETQVRDLAHLQLISIDTIKNLESRIFKDKSSKNTNRNRRLLVWTRKKAYL